MLTQTEQMIVEGVAKRGWFVVNCVPSGAEDDESFFSYSVGLSKTMRWPEIIIVGLDGDRANGILGDLLQLCWNEKQIPAPGLVADGIVQGLPVKLVDFAGGNPHAFEFADWFAKRESAPPPRRLQLLWPDRNGVLPDDAACDPDVRRKQAIAAAA